jgi:segregation and condensation protein B
METEALTPLIEALLFASADPLTVGQIVKMVDEEDVTAAEVKAVLDALLEAYENPPRGFQLVKLGQGYQILTRERYAPWVERLAAGRRGMRLSRAALETAAVIGYKQPITRHEIERIRGVDVGAVLQTLLERNLIMIKGRDNGPGRPLLYGTTQEFLEYFGLARLNDLPQLDEIAALAREKGGASWTDDERNRFVRHGVEPDSVPSPWDEATGEGDVPAAAGAAPADGAREASTEDEDRGHGEELPPPGP